jgi:guanylate kinase
LVHALLKRVPNTRLSVSCTTRSPRPHEVDGKDYSFISREEFERRRERGEFLEWAEVFNNLYGTSRRMVEESLACGCDVVLDIDVQGAAQVRELASDAVSIFILPRSFSVLEQRLRARGTEAPAVLEQRLQRARQEVLQYAQFQYLVINDELEDACQAVEAIVRGERQRRHRQEEQAQIILHTFEEG